MSDLEMLEQTMTPSVSIEPTVKDQLIKCISSGQSKKLLGKEIEVEDLDKMNSKELDKLYKTYKCRLASAMTKSLGESMINSALFTCGVHGLVTQRYRRKIVK